VCPLRDKSWKMKEYLGKEIRGRRIWEKNEEGFMEKEEENKWRRKDRWENKRRRRIIRERKREE